MRNSCVVCSLAVMLCVVVCVFANAEVSQADATKEVEEAKESVTTVCARALNQFNNATSVLEKVESSNREAAQAYSQAAEAAKDTPKALEIANTIKSVSDAITASYQSAKVGLESIVSSLTTLRLEAQELDGKSNIDIQANTGSPTDFTDTNKKATDLKGQATALDGKITSALERMDELYSTANDMENNAKKSQLGYSHVSVVIAIAKIESTLVNANNIIRQIEEKKSEVNDIVRQMQTLKTNGPGDTIESINILYNNANGELTKATGAVDSAVKDKADMTQQKEAAKAALAKVETITKVSEAQEEVEKTEACFTNAQQIVPKLKTALQTAETSVTNAKALKEQMETALSTTTIKPGTEQSVTDPEVKTLQSSISAAVDAIQTMMAEADSTLQETENHKNEVNEIVQEMKALKTTAKSESNEDINELCRTSEGELTKATKAVETVKTEKEAMKQQKILADAALIEVNAATEIEKAQPQVATATSCLDNVKQSLDQVRSALQTAKNSVAKANDLKQQLKEALSTTTTAPTLEEVKATEKSDLSLVKGTGIDQKDTTIQPTSKDLPDQSHTGTDKLKDALIYGAQNVPTTALTGKKAAAPGANNDSAMTVSVPLLVALIASAVLQ